MNVPSPAGHQAEPEPGQVYYGPCGRPEPGTETDPDLGHGYDGPELHSGTPEYEAGYAEYQAWAGQAGPENEPVPYTLTPQAEAVCASWDAFLKVKPEALAWEAPDYGLTGPEPEAEP